MGCSCNKNRRPGNRPAAVPPRTSINNRIGQSATTRRAAQPNTVQSLNAQSQLNPAGINAEKRRLQTQRRQMIQNRMKQR